MSQPDFPVLDVSRIHEAAAQRTLADAFGRTLQEYGFASVSGHGVSPALRARAYAAAQAFFALPTEKKLAYHLPGRGGERGYTPFRVETAKDQFLPDLKEFWHVGRELPRAEAQRHGLPPNLWPSEVADFRESMLALYAALDQLGASLLSLIATHLGLDPSWFDDKVSHGNSILRPLHYPALTGEYEGVRSAAHEDINLITLLIGSGEPGLEILRPDGSYLPIATPEDVIVVNVGDMLQRLTNHVLPSTTHRVVNPPAPWSQRARYSMPFFLHFNPEVTISTLPSCITEARPDRYPTPITANDYLLQRLREIGLL